MNRTNKPIWHWVVTMTVCLTLVVPMSPYTNAVVHADETELAASPESNVYTPVTDDGFVRQPYGVPTTEKEDDLEPVNDSPDEPFDWYRYPHTAIGVYGGPAVTAITPEGYVQNRIGTLHMSAGSTPQPVNQRVKTWKDGWLPVLHADFERDGVRNHIEYFSSNIEDMTKIPYTEWWGNPRKELVEDVDNTVTFVKVDLTNTSDKQKTYSFVTDMDDKTIIRSTQNPPTAENPGPSRPKTVNWDSESGAVVGEGKVLYTASREPVSTKGAELTFDIDIAPGSTESIIFKVPFWVAQESDLQAMNSADYNSHLDQTVEFWERTLGDAGTQIDIPGDADLDKVMDTYRASIVLSLIDLDIIGGKYFWKANPTRYKNYWLRDTAFDINGLLNAGFDDVAREVVLMMLDYQKPDGQFESQPNQPDGNGQALWSFGMYYERTKDKEFARQVWPAVKDAMEWEWQLRKTFWNESGGLFPYLNMPDNEKVKGHIIGYDLWAIAGERAAAKIARAVGEGALADEWTERANEYEEILREQLSPTVEELGWIPPTIEGMNAPINGRQGWYGDVYGIDWGNLEVVWPTGVFSPDESWVEESLQEWRNKTREGIFTYPSGGQESILHSYTPMSISDTYVRRGDQVNALQDLYNLLVHTSATHTAAEVMSSAQRWGWSKTDQTQPHGEFAGKYLTLLRDMLAHEQDGELHLGSIISPVWSKPGQQIDFSGQTDFGLVEYLMTFTEEGATVELDIPKTPEGVVLGIPDGRKVTSVTVNGKKVETPSGPLKLPDISGQATVEIQWELDEDSSEWEQVKDLSFSRAVQDYLDNYKKANEPLDLSLGKSSVSGETVTVGEEVTFTSTLINRGGAGWLKEQPVLYVDGQRTDYEFPEVSRGVGFDTPSNVVSFDQLHQGTVPLTYSTSFCEPGEHTFAVGFGEDSPSESVRVNVVEDEEAPAPTAEISFEQSVYPFSPGETKEVTATVHNPSCFEITGIEGELSTEEGWTVEPAPSSDLNTLPPSESGTLKWLVQAPEQPAKEESVLETDLTATVNYGWKGEKAGSVTAKAIGSVLSGVQEPYRTHQSHTEAWFGQSGDQFAIYAGGEDMWKGTDQFGSIYLPQSVTEQTTVTTKVLSQGDTWPWAKAGIVIRNNMAQHKSEGYVIVGVTPENGWIMQWDSDGDGLLDKKKEFGMTTYPSWVRLERDGSTFTGSFSLDGESWVPLATVTVPGVADVADAGLFATAVNRHVPGAISGVQFDGLLITDDANISIPMMLDKLEEYREEFSSEASYRVLHVHLTAVGRYEEQEAADKVVKHMESFKLLLDHQKENELISEKAYNALKYDAEKLIQKWQ